MLEHIFLKILNMSLTASIIIVIVMIARIFLKRYPKYISYALWSVVLFRLICPLSIETSISVVPNSDTLLSDNMLSHSTLGNEIIEDNANTTINRGQTAFPTVDSETELGYATIVKPNPTETFNFSELTLQEKFIFIGKYVWLAGIAAMLLYCVLSAIKIRRKVQISVKLSDNIYIADEMISPFVMGVVRPKIYLPYCLSEKEQKYIITHEQYHIRRFDHVIKIVSFIALSLHWFNPFVWVAFILSGKDMEMSCDEAVIKTLGEGIRADYSASLLAIATGYKGRNGFPVSFGESDTKTRIKNIANMRTVKKSVLAVVTVAVIVLTVYLATNRSSSSGNVATNEEYKAFENGAFDNILSQKEYAADVENIFFTRDYDNDGNIESFVIVGNKDDFYGDEMLYGDLWFVSSEFEANALLNDAYMYIEQPYFEADDGKSYLVFSYIEGNPVLSDVYGVVDNCAIDMILYGESARIEGDEIIVTSSDYDFICDKEDYILTGHTWKDYAFYYENGAFYPYKGEVVGNDCWEAYANGNDIYYNELFGDGSNVAFVQTIKRENGYIHMNIARDDGDYLEFSHRTYKVDDKNRLVLVEEDEGCYKANIDDDSETAFTEEVIEYYKEATSKYTMYLDEIEASNFIDNVNPWQGQDYDNDGLIDRVYRNAYYSDGLYVSFILEFGNGEVLELQDRESIFTSPTITSTDIIGDGNPEILVVVMHGDSTDPYAQSDIALYTKKNQTYEIVPLAIKTVDDKTWNNYFESNDKYKVGCIITSKNLGDYQVEISCEKAGYSDVISLKTDEYSYDDYYSYFNSDIAGAYAYDAEFVQYDGETCIRFYEEIGSKYINRILEYIVGIGEINNGYTYDFKYMGL